MDKMLVVVFDSETKAYECSEALQELHWEGSINLYSQVVIARDASGKVEVKQEGDMGPAGTAVGLLTGSLIGMIGGPVGLVLGAGAGTFGDMVYDLAHLGVGEDFLKEVEKSLQPGKAAVVAEVWEEWTAPVDTRLGALGGVIHRRERKDVLNDLIEQDIAAIKADIAELEAEFTQASVETKAKLQKKLDAARDRLRDTRDGIQARIEASQIETDAKIKYLEEQTSRESNERKAKRESLITELRAEQTRRSHQLKQVLENAKEAMK